MRTSVLIAQCWQIRPRYNFELSNVPNSRNFARRRFFRKVITVTQDVSNTKHAKNTVAERKTIVRQVGEKKPILMNLDFARWDFSRFWRILKRGFANFWWVVWNNFKRRKCIEVFICLTLMIIKNVSFLGICTTFWKS